MKILTTLAGLILAGAIVMPSPTVAAPVGGDSGVQVSGGTYHRQGSDSGAFTADLSYGYFFSPSWELGIRQGVNYNFIDNGRDFWTATTTPFIHFNLPLGRFVPTSAAASVRLITIATSPGLSVRMPA